MLKRITYVSRFAVPMTAEDLAKLGKTSAEKNERLGLTGVLMASGGLYYQVLEGPPAAVDELWTALKQDIRHNDVLLLRSDENVESRVFPDSSMATVNLEASSHVRMLPLKALIKAVYEHQRLISTLTWAIERSIEQVMTIDDEASDS